MKNRISSLIAMLPLLAGCALHSREARTYAGITGAALVAGSLATFAWVTHGEDTDGDGIDEFPDGALNCLGGGCLISAALAVAGVVLIASAVIPGPPEVALPSIGAAPAAPTGSADPETLRLMTQARSLAASGQCAAAWRVVEQVRDRDATAHCSLRLDPALAACR